MDDPMAMKRPAGVDENAGMKRKAYEKELRKLQVELPLAGVGQGQGRAAWSASPCSVSQKWCHATRILLSKQGFVPGNAFLDPSISLKPLHSKKFTFHSPLALGFFVGGGTRCSG
jgi:hypothetical protein